MKHKLILPALLPVLILLLSLSVKPDKTNNTVPGKIMVQFLQSVENDIPNITASYSDVNIKVERCLSDDLNIWLLSYDQSKTTSRELLHDLRKEKSIALVQPDHYISLREKFPNDPSFAMQWALNNIGQTGGVDDADIDATDAWEINVNTGSTLLGDTIVVAVIDDGFYLNHEDMNYWKNRNEIPGNGIDDDDNGYVDDFDGWNAYTGTGEITSKSHGTRVAGIVGAIGDNNIGICGVGWNGKILPVSGSSTFESTVVEAFAYVYKMRSLYDETGGERGAYIVATNGSFGVDYASPDDYPIWHMMYDSLGSLGILNAAATMNHESDVDKVGDVPTTFDTEFLLGVTNTTNKDVKYDVAAWGAESIDLGAPGSNILSTRTNNAYGYSTGTSFASPHVAGSIALLFAAADSAFLERYDEKPSETAIFLKNVILDGVDTLSGFDTLCTSGGRLNVNNAMQILLNPRIEIPSTLSYQLAPDSTGPYALEISNLLGFDLPYECSISSSPSWVTCVHSSGTVPANGNEMLDLHFDATGLTEGSYQDQLILNDAGGRKYSCEIELEIIPGLGISDPDLNGFHVKCYPNPFTSSLSIEMSIRNDVRIYSISGEMMLEKTCEKGITRIEASWFPAGVYIVGIDDGMIFRQMKVIKH